MLQQIMTARVYKKVFSLILMDAIDLEKLGLNMNEAKVYWGLLQKGQASAAELVKQVGVHRNIIYDNLEKLIEKGVVSFTTIENKKIFISQDSSAILNFLDNEKEKIDEKKEYANTLISEINKLNEMNYVEQAAEIFRGISGIKKVLSLILESKENFTLGMTNKSTQLLGELYWKNFNAKIKDLNIQEKILLNSSFEKEEYFFKKNKNIECKTLPQEFDQITETIIFENQVAIFIYSEQPIVFLIKDRNFYISSKNQFDFFWKKCN
jgi:sugar-specific transcriptional regulator TrmB